MEREKIIQTVCLELYEKGNADIISKVFSTDYTAFSEGKKYSGRDFIKTYLNQLKNAFENTKVEKLEFYSISENAITWHRTLSGNHNKTLMGIPPSGKKVIWHEMLYTEFDDQLISKEWMVSNLAGQLMVKLGKG